MMMTCCISDGLLVLPFDNESRKVSEQVSFWTKSTQALQSRFVHFPGFVLGTGQS